MVKKFRIISITFLLVDKRFSEHFSQFSGRDSLEVFFVFFVGNVNDESRRSYRHHIAVVRVPDRSTIHGGGMCR